MVPTPEALRIISVVVFFLLFFAGMRRSIWLVVAYMILVYCKLSAYYQFLEAIRAEMLFAMIILLKLLITDDLLKKISFKFNPVNKYLYLFSACVAFAYLIAWDQAYSWEHAVYHFIKNVILYFMILPAINTESDLKIFVWSMVVMFVYLAYEPMYGYVMNVGGSEHYYGTNYIAEIGILSGHVALANNMNQMIPIALFGMIGVQEKKIKYLSLIPIVIFFLALVGSGSRGGVVGFAFFLMLLVAKSKNKLRNFIVVGLVAVLIFLFTDKVQHTTGRISSQSAGGRLTGLTHGIGIIMKGNLFGVGPGCFKFARGRYFHYTMDSHNIYGEVLGDLGLPGATAWGIFVLMIFKNFNYAIELSRTLDKGSSIRYLLIGLKYSLIVRLFISMASHGLYYFYWYTIAALSIAAVKMLEIDHDKMKSSVPL